MSYYVLRRIAITSAFLGSRILTSGNVPFLLQYHIVARSLQTSSTLFYPRITKKNKRETSGCFENCDQFKSFTSTEELLETYSLNKWSGRPFNQSKRIAILLRVSRIQMDSEKNLENDTIEELLEDILYDIKTNSSECQPRELADVLWAMAKLNIKDVSLFTHFEKEVKYHELYEFSNKDLAMILYAFGKVQLSSPVLFSLIRKEILSRDMSTFNSHELSQFVWAFARTKDKGAELFAHVEDEIRRRNLKDFANRALVTILWSYAEAGHDVKKLFLYIRKDLQNRSLTRFGSIQIAQMMWAFAVRGVKATEFFVRVEQEIIRRGIDTLDHQGLVMVLYAFTKACNPSRLIFSEVQKKLDAVELTKFNSGQLVKLLWSFASTNMLKPDLLSRLSTAILSHNLAELSDAALEELVISVQMCRLRAEQLVAGVETELVRRTKH